MPSADDAHGFEGRFVAGGVDLGQQVMFEMVEIGHRSLADKALRVRRGAGTVKRPSRAMATDSYQAVSADGLGKGE